MILRSCSLKYYLFTLFFFVHILLSTNLNLHVNAQTQSCLIYGCNGNGECIRNTNGKAYCECYQGYKGSLCNEFSCAEKSNCNNNGHCRGPNECFCYPGWDGSDCSKFICEEKKHCNGNGKCVRSEKQLCECNKGYKGKNCDQKLIPQVLSANLTNQGKEISILFDQTTNQADDRKCDEIFVNSTYISLGSNPYCYWSSKKQFNVKFGQNPSFSIGDFLEFRNGVITLEDSSNSLSISKIKINQTKQEYLPKAKIDGIQKIAFCDDLELGADSSIDYSGRNDLNFQWRIDSDTMKTGELNALQNQIDEQQGLSWIILSDFPQSVNFTIYLEAINFMNFSSTTQLTVFVEGAPIPKVSMQKREFNITASDTLYLQPSVSLSRCSESTHLEFKWEIVSPDNMELDSDIKSFKNLLIQPGLLQAGNSYVFGFTVYSPNGEVSDTVSVNIVFVGLTAEVKGGDHRKLATEGVLTLDGSLSYDPDLVNGNESFEWFCETSLGDICKTSTQNTLVLPKQKTISIEPYTLLAGEYIFTLKYSKEDRSDTTSVNITLTFNSVPDVEIITASSRVNAHEKLKIEAEARSRFNMSLSLKWSETNHDFQLDDEVLLSSIENENLVLAPFVLQEGKHYSFMLEATDKTGTASTTKEIYVNTPPKNGRCSVSPNQGITMQTEFRIECSDWEDDSGKMFYEFKYTKGDSTEVTFNPKSEISQFKTKNIPVGVTNLIVYISNTYGAFTRYLIRVNVESPQSTKDVKNYVKDAETELNKLNATGNNEESTRKISAVISVINNQNSENESDVQYRKTARNTFTDRLDSISQEIRYTSSAISQVAPVVVDVLGVSEESDEIVTDKSSMIMDRLLSRDTDIGAFEGLENYYGSFANNFAEALYLSDKSTTLSKKLSKYNDLLSMKILRTKTSGEIPTYFNGKSLGIKFQKLIKEDMGGSLITSPHKHLNESSKFHLPKSIISQEKSNKDIGYSYTEYPEPPFPVINMTCASPINSLKLFSEDEEMEVQDLKRPITINVRAEEVQLNETLTKNCMWYDNSIDDWSSEGCELIEQEYNGYYVCDCNHLTDFGIFVIDSALPEYNKPGFSEAVSNLSDNQAILYVTLSFYALYWIAMVIGFIYDRRKPSKKQQYLEKSYSSKESRYWIVRKFRKWKNSNTFLGEIVKSFRMHTWISIFSRDRHEQYSRPMRITVVFSVILGAICANLMFFNTTQNGTPQILLAGFISACAMFPGKFLLRQVFRKATTDSESNHERTSKYTPNERVSNQGQESIESLVEYDVKEHKIFGGKEPSPQISIELKQDTDEGEEYDYDRETEYKRAKRRKWFPALKKRWFVLLQVFVVLCAIGFIFWFYGGVPWYACVLGVISVELVAAAKNVMLAMYLFVPLVATGVGISLRHTAWYHAVYASLFFLLLCITMLFVYYRQFILASIPNSIIITGSIIYLFATWYQVPVLHWSLLGSGNLILFWTAFTLWMVFKKPYVWMLSFDVCSTAISILYLGLAEWKGKETEWEGALVMGAIQFMAGLILIGTIYAFQKRRIFPETLPRWTTWIGWGFAFTTQIIFLTYIIFTYASLGQNVELSFFESVTISYLQDILVLEPIKLLMAAIVAAISKSPIAHILGKSVGKGIRGGLRELPDLLL